MSRLLVTGASGFVGSHLCERLRTRGMPLAAAVRRKQREDQIEVGDLNADTAWSGALAGCDAVVHLAARVHVMNDAAADPLRAFREVNVDGTMNLARQAAQTGVRRFVFVSSIKVNGEETQGTPFTHADIPAPSDPYGQSKHEAELRLRELEAASGMQVAIVRPPLIYGPGVRANFLRLMQMVRRGVPLPFGRVDNRRSMAGIDNLIDLLEVCAYHPNAAGQTFLVSDGADLSLPEMIRAIAHAMNRPARLLPVPAGLMAAGAKLLGKEELARRLLGSLQVDIGHTRAVLGWNPPVPVATGMQRTVSHFLAQRSG
jgi:nucleoside-diphosphate-sugar epimerase